MNRTMVNKLNTATREALEKVAAEYGVEVIVGGGSFDSGTFKPKVIFSESDAAANEWARSAGLLGLDPADFGRQFQLRGRYFVITGLNLRAPKYPVQARCLDDERTYKFAEHTVKAALR